MLPVRTRRAAKVTRTVELTTGNKRVRREVNGILLVDKPLGISSNACLQRAKWLYRSAKAGHTGALDPLATGVLPLCFGEATKVSQFLLEADKRYLTRVKLGERTNTADSEGEIIASHPVADVSRDDVVKALSQFRGEIIQVPPMYSALKHQGQPLYKLARAGQEVDRKCRNVTVYELILHEFHNDGQEASLELEIHCSKGTYVRTIADDLGQLLGCGGHVTALRRLQAGVFGIAGCVTLDSLQRIADEQGEEGLDALLLVPDQAIEHLPAITLSEECAGFVRQGQAVTVRPLPTLQGDDTLVRLYEDQEFFGIGAVLDDGRVAPRRLMRETTR